MRCIPVYADLDNVARAEYNRQNAIDLKWGAVVLFAPFLREEVAQRISSKRSIGG